MDTPSHHNRTHRSSCSHARRSLCHHIYSGRYSPLVLLIILLTAWLTVHVARGVLDFHNNQALKTKEREQVKLIAAREFREGRERLAIDYHYGNMEEGAESDDVIDDDMKYFDDDSGSEGVTPSGVAGDQTTDIEQIMDYKYNDGENREFIEVGSDRYLSLDEFLLDDKTVESEKLKANGMLNMNGVEFVTDVVESADTMEMLEKIQKNNGAQIRHGKLSQYFNLDDDGNEFTTTSYGTIVTEKS